MMDIKKKMYESDFWFHNDRNLNFFGDKKDSVANFLLNNTRQQSYECDFSLELDRFFKNDIYNEKVFFIYNYLISESLILLSSAFAEYMLYDRNKYECFQKLPPQDRIRIQQIIRVFHRYINAVQNDDNLRIRVFLEGLNNGVITTTLLLEMFRFNYVGELDDGNKIGYTNKYYDWYRSALNTLWMLKFLKREISLLSELNLSRGTSIYFTHNVSYRKLIDFIKLMVDRSQASRPYVKSKSKKTKKQSEKIISDNSDLLKEYSDEEKAKIRAIMQSKRCNINNAIIIYNIQKQGEKRK